MRLRTCSMWMAGLALAGAAVHLTASAAAPEAVPFKLGTFRAADREYVGLVLKDSMVVDIAAANTAWERSNAAAAKLRMPTDMKDLIARYDTELGPRLRELARLASSGTRDYVRPVAQVKTLPPVRPSLILNAGANYPEHAAGIIEQGARAAAAQGAAPAGPPGPARQPAQSAPGYWERAPGDARPDNPYLFLKSPTAVVGADDDVVIPRGRVQIDWECEFAVVVGRKAKNVSVKDAPGYVFG
jgi:hypothetical protein